MSLPQHIGIIMDGNRRYARELMKSPWLGHKSGVHKTREVLKWVDELGIPYVSAYVLSAENLQTRPKTELKMIFKYFNEEAEAVLSGQHEIHETQTRVRFIGRLELLPEDLRKRITKIENLTSKYNRHQLTICIAYGGQQEIVDACKEIAARVSNGAIKPAEINEKVFTHYLYLNGTIPYPDLIVRTGGERRLSNFLIWQSAYAELAFIKKRWPELDKRTFMAILRDYSQRHRRFGK